MKLKKTNKAFLMVAATAVKKYAKNLSNHQYILMAAADMLIQIYRAESAVLRTEKSAKSHGEKSVEAQIAMSQLGLYHAVEIIARKGKEAIISFASEIGRAHV